MPCLLDAASKSHDTKCGREWRVEAGVRPIANLVQGTPLVDRRTTASARKLPCPFQPERGRIWTALPGLPRTCVTGSIRVK